MDCKEFRTIVADLFDKEVSPETQKACDEHISHCAECRDYYEGLLDAVSLLRPKHSPVSQKRNAPSRRRLQMAAMFIGVLLLLSGIAFATVQLMRQSQQPVKEHPTTTDSQQAIINHQLPSPVRFDDVRLDSILTVVSAHYGKTVNFRSEEPKSMKFIMTWKPDAPLADFIDRMNMFDGLRLSLNGDTIFVETIGNQSNI